MRQNMSASDHSLSMSQCQIAEMATKTHDEVSLQEAPFWMESEHTCTVTAPKIQNASMYTKIGTCTNLEHFTTWWEIQVWWLLPNNNLYKYRHKTQLSKTSTKKQPVSKVMITFRDYCNSCYCENSNRLRQLNQGALLFCLHDLHVIQDTREQCYTSFNHSHLLHLYWKRIKNLYITHNCLFTVIIKTIHPA